VFVGMKPAPLLKPVTDTTICYNHPLTLFPYLLDSNPNFSYKWAGPDSFSSTLSNPVIDSVSPATTGVYTLVVTLDTDGCTASQLSYVNAYVPPLPLVSADSVFCTGDPAYTLGASGTDVRWYGGPTDATPIAPPLIATDRAGNYQFFATQTIRQCESPKEPVSIAVKNCCDGNVFIPTAFSPNNDGLNDEFIIHPDFGYFIKQMVVCNRWGEVVYDGVTGKWDGRYAGATCETGVYFYLLKLGCIRGGEVVKRGDVTLIR